MIVWNNYRSGLKGEFADAVDAALAPMADVWHVTQGLRTMVEQEALYAQGRTAPGAIVTNAQPGQSPHNPGGGLLKCWSGTFGWPGASLGLRNEPRWEYQLG